jgi:hypothetical protein
MLSGLAGIVPQVQPPADDAKQAKGGSAENGATKVTA